MDFIKTSKRKLQVIQNKLFLNLILKNRYILRYNKFYKCEVYEYKNEIIIPISNLTDSQRQNIRNEYSCSCDYYIKIIGQYEYGDDCKIYIDGKQIYDFNLPVLLSFYIAENNKLTTGTLFKLKYRPGIKNFVFIFNDFRSIPWLAFDKDNQKHIEHYNIKNIRVVKITGRHENTKITINNIPIQQEDAMKMWL